MFNPQPKPPKKKKKKREKVTDITYYQVYTRDKGTCQLCGYTQNLHLHHVVYRSEDRSRINDKNNCIMLCLKCHQMVHQNKKYWKSKLFDIIHSKEEYKRGVIE